MAWLVIAGLVLGVCLNQTLAPLPIAISSLAGLALAVLVLGAAILFYRRVRVRPNFAASCAALIHALVFSAAGSILSYLLARRGGSFWDDRLTQWDHALGFDWLAYVRFVDSHAWLTLVYKVAYGSLIPQMILVILTLGFSGKLDQLRAVMLAAIVSGTVTVLLSPLFPALSNYVHLGLGPEEFRHVDPFAGYVHLADMEALRHGTMTVLHLSKMQGIITFPSYHAALALVMLWGFWISRVRIVRWAGAALALTTIAATPVDGGHYLVDVLAGLAIAAASILAARRMIFFTLRLPSLRASSSRRSRAAFGQ